MKFGGQIIWRAELKGKAARDESLRLSAVTSLRRCQVGTEMLASLKSSQCSRARRQKGAEDATLRVMRNDGGEPRLETRSQRLRRN